MPQPEEIETTTSAQIELPEFEFSYPDAFIGDDGGFDLVAKQSCSNILTCSVLRGHRKVSRVKKLINRLKKQDKIDRKGGFAKKGPKGRISGDIEALEGDEKGYDFKGTVCLDQKLMMVFYWNKDQTKLQFVSDLNSSPFDDDEAIENLARLFVDTSGDEPIVTVDTQGPHKVTDKFIQEGSILRERVETTRFKDQNTKIRMMADWYTDENQASWGGSYATGLLEEGGEGSYIAYRRVRKLICPGEFNEDAAAPNWCIARNLKTKKILKKANLDELIETYKSYGHLKRADFEPILFEDPKGVCHGSDPL